MPLDRFTKAILIVIVVLLGILVVLPVLQPAPVRAQASEAYPFYIEPGVTTIRKPDGTGQWYGRMVVDMRTGDIWGFPMPAQNTPYPVYGPSDNPKVSHPMYLGRMAFSEATR